MPYVQIGSQVTIQFRGSDGGPGEVVGVGRIIHPQAIQALPPLDERLSTVARRAEELLITTGEASHQVVRIRPGLVGYAEAAEILAREIPQVELVATETGLVVLEIDDIICDDPEGICNSSWWCKIICLNSCSSC